MKSYLWSMLFLHAVVLVNELVQGKSPNVSARRRAINVGSSVVLVAWTLILIVWGAE